MRLMPKRFLPVPKRAGLKAAALGSTVVLGMRACIIRRTAAKSSSLTGLSIGGVTSSKKWMGLLV